MAALRTDQVAARLNCSIQTVCRLCRSGRLRAFRLQPGQHGSDWRVDEAEVERFIQQQTAAPASAAAPAVAAPHPPRLHLRPPRNG